MICTSIVKIINYRVAFLYESQYLKRYTDVAMQLRRLYLFQQQLFHISQVRKNTVLFKLKYAYKYNTHLTNVSLKNKLVQRFYMSSKQGTCQKVLGLLYCLWVSSYSYLHFGLIKKLARQIIGLKTLSPIVFKYVVYPLRILIVFNYQ